MALRPGKGSAWGEYLASTSSPEGQQSRSQGRPNRKYDGPIHHIATDKDHVYHPQTKQIFDQAGLSMQSPYNRMRIPGHVGPHGQFVNSVIFQRLQNAIAGKPVTQWRTALVDELKAIRVDIRKNGWDTLFKAGASRADVQGKF